MKVTIKPNEKQTTLPTGDPDDKNQGSLKVELPNNSNYSNKSKYGK